MSLTFQKNVIQSDKSKKHVLLPDFLIIGAGKSGTTSLDNYLKQHPEIFIPAIKEPNFFGYENSKNEDFRSDPQEAEHFRESVTDLREYLALFRDSKPIQVRGETSNTYLYHKQAPARIKHYIPNVKLIAILRQPADRLYSRFLHLAREKRLPTASFSDCLHRQSIWWSRNDLINEGFYYKNLVRYFRLFPENNIRVFLYEEFNDHPEKILRNIYSFLNVDQQFKANLSVKYNRSGFVKNSLLDRMYGPTGLITRAAKTVLPTSAFLSLKNNVKVQYLVNLLWSKNLVRPEMDPIIRKWLTQDVYGNDIKKLANLIGKDLSHWLY